ncbi:hypothetical protein OOJ09_23545 [Mesorhizobium qingshengii]|uniref:Uncharacterized protein n=1 Tax=Mesorhizobium qingshengii TaxID=1165689 RepID=A0ABT4R055_9HYPH|nr:hypothetical protein [Mesorhizobium qingshengii]MCZ8547175.1 hypothetical protein [Mesorhizobium qingshengii]
MTVASETNRSGPYNGNGVTTVFDYEFRIVSENHVKVIKADAAGIETILTIDADYIVSDVGNSAGGQVALTAPLPAGHRLTLLRSVPFTQETDLQNQGAYYAETVEASFDLAAMRDQELQEQISRSLLIPASEDPAQLTGLVGDILRLADSADEIDALANNLDSLVKKSDASTSGFGFVVDEDDMASNSATKVPTQQSAKAYVDRRTMGVNILAFGCKPDNGATDNLAPFLAAVAFAVAGGFALYAPSGGTYHFSAKVDIPALTGGQQLTIRGAGAEATVFHWPNANGGMQATLVNDGWWTRSPQGNPFQIDGVTFSTGVEGGGVGLKVIANRLEGRPAPTLLYSDIVFRGSGGTYRWDTGLYMSKASQNHVSNVRWFGKVLTQAGTFFKISSEADATHDPVAHFFNGCEGTYADKWLDAGDDVEGIHIINCDGVSVNYGVNWVVSITGSESQLAMANCHINAVIAAANLQGIFHSHIVGNLFFTQGDGIVMNRVGYNTIANNVISGPGAGAGSAISIGTGGGGWSATWKNTVTGNDLRDFTNGIVVGTGVTGVKTGINSFTNITNELVDTDGTNDMLDRVQLIGANLTPKVADGVALGTAALPFSDVFLATGGTLDFANGNVRLVQQPSALILQIGGANAYAIAPTVMRPTANDGAALGAPTIAWSDLFLATGGVLNWANGDVTITHSTDALAFAGAANGYSFDQPIKISGNQIIKAREIGWTAGTGTANKGAFASYAGQTHTGAYVQATVQALDDAARNASQRIKAIEDALRVHGLIN